MTDLVELLRSQLAAAEHRNDATAVKVAALRLGRRLDDADEVADVYRGALRWADTDAELLSALLVALGERGDVEERAQLTEQLVAVEPAETGAPRALELVALYESLGDDDGVLRALKLGYQRAPDNEALRQRLEARYRERGDFQGLAQTLLDAAERQEDPHSRVLLLRDAATVYAQQLAHAAGAAHLLSQALELTPDDLSLRIDLAHALSASSDHERAVSTLSDALTARDDDETPMRLELLLARSQAFAAGGDSDRMLADLESAFAIAPQRVAPSLGQAHEHCRQQAAEANDPERQREHTMRCVDMFLQQGARAEASELLGSWVQQVPDDLEALRRVRDIDTADERWERVATTCERLVQVETDAAQIDAVLALAHAYHALETPAEARSALEAVLTQQPANLQVRAELRDVYEQTGDRHQLAKLLMEDAAVLEDLTERRSLLLRAGQLFIELGDAAAAVPALRQALDVASDADTIAALADSYIALGWFDDANELLDENITAGRGRRTPQISMFFHRKARVAEAQGDRQKQLNFLQEAHTCAKKNGVVAAALADLAEQLEQWELAAKTLRTITLIDTNCPVSRPQAFARQARIAMRQGDEKNAKIWARRARREDPESAEITALLQELGEKVSIPPARR